MSLFADPGAPPLPGDPIPQDGPPTAGMQFDWNWQHPPPHPGHWPPPGNFNCRYITIKKRERG